jgi:hypothetical protein
MAIDRNIGGSGAGTSRGSINRVATVETISALKTFSGPEDGLSVQGYYAAGDNGGGEFYWDSASTATNNDGTIIQATGVTTGRWMRIYDGDLNTSWFGAKGDGVADDTAAIQATIAVLSSGAGQVFIPAGTYLVTSTILIDKDRTHIYGTGVGSTHITFEPTANDTCFLFENDNDGVLYQGSLKHMSFSSVDTTYLKKIIEVIDCSGYIFENLGTVYPHVYGAGSTFAHFKGRELCACSDWYAFADRVILLDKIPAPHPAVNIGCDHHNFHNMYLGSGAASGYSVIEVADGLLLTSLSFTGYQAWIGGEHGLYWNDTTSSAVSSDISFNNVRFEQGVDTTKYLYYISHNFDIQNLSIKGGRGGDRAGIYLRKVSNFKVDDFYYTSATLEAFNADATVRGAEGSNCFWQSGSTATIAGQKLIWESPKYPNTGALAPSFLYTLASNAAYPVIGDTQTFTPTLNSFTEVVGGGSITPTGRYTRIGKNIYVQVKIVCAGGATIASVAGTSTITGQPACQYDGAVSVVDTNLLSLGNGVAESTFIYTPVWSANGNTIYISGMYEVA